MKLQSFFDKLEEDDKVDPSVMRLIKLLGEVVFVSHFVGCMYAYYGTWEEKNWLTAYGIADAAPSEKWGVSLYWAVTVLTTVGYGDVLPINSTEQLLNIFW